MVDWAKAAPVDHERLLRALKRAPSSLDELARSVEASPGSVLDAILAEQKAGRNVVRFGDRYTIGKVTAQIARDVALHEWKSDARGRYRFGVISDTHYGSKYCREEVADELYDWFASEGIRRVYHAGNWIDGEHPGHGKFDLVDEAHGLQNQLDYMVAKYPLRKGITTYYVAGDDHEGWYNQREGVDSGRMLETTARDAGRTDLRYIGYMETYVTLRHANSGNESRLLVCHPGGGSGYAISYAPQKAIESWQPGEKPGCVLFGHWHKIEYLNVRGVHSIQAGCTKDQDPFARKKRLQYHIGGWIVELIQDAGGALTGCTPQVRQWFDRGYHNGQWSHSGKVRTAGKRA
jgi:predicted phosphodiesterase